MRRVRSLFRLILGTKMDRECMRDDYGHQPVGQRSVFRNRYDRRARAQIEGHTNPILL